MLPNKAFVAFLSIAWANLILGVSPEKQSLYTPDKHGKWHCLLDPSIELLFEQINDDFCDCPDGSDEPGTNACEFSQESPRYFYCANEGYKAGYIENYKLNDGVCDYDICCDGSDEYKSGKCPNVCDQVKDQFDNFMNSRKSAVEDALKIKKGLEQKASTIKQKLVKSAENLKDDILKDEADLKILNEKLQHEKSLVSENLNTEGSIIEDSLREHLRKLETRFSEWKAHSKNSNERIDLLESMLQNLLQNYNPNFNDQAVKQAVSSFADYISNKPGTENEPILDISEFNLDHVAQNLQNVIAENPLPEEDSSALGKLLGKSRSLFKKSDKKPSPQAVLDHVNEKVEELAKQIVELEKQINQKRSEESIYRDGINTEYGESDIYRAVKGLWVSKKIGEYNYKLGFLDSLYQDNTLVGRFQGIQGSSMFFAQGSKCWNGPQRSARVDMVCGPQHELISVAEPEKCQYRFLMNSPLACVAMREEEIAQDFKVDRTKLEL